MPEYGPTTIPHSINATLLGDWVLVATSVLAQSVSWATIRKRPLYVKETVCLGSKGWSADYGVSPEWSHFLQRERTGIDRECV